VSGTLKKLVFKRPWQTYCVGDEVVPNGVLRDWLLANDYCQLAGTTPALLPDKKPGVRDKAKAVTQAPGAVFTR